MGPGQQPILAPPDGALGTTTIKIYSMQIETLLLGFCGVFKWDSITFYILSGIPDLGDK